MRLHPTRCFCCLTVVEWTISRTLDWRTHQMATQIFWSKTSKLFPIGSLMSVGCFSWHVKPVASRMTNTYTWIVQWGQKCRTEKFKLDVFWKFSEKCLPFKKKWGGQFFVDAPRKTKHTRYAHEKFSQQKLQGMLLLSNVSDIEA